MVDKQTASQGKRADESVADFLVRNVEAHSHDLVRVTAEHFGVTRQAVHRALKNLERGRRIVGNGQTRNRRYRLGPIRELAVTLPVTVELDEHDVWSENVLPVLEGLPANVLAICEYGLTEMVNNVVDHSGGDSVIIGVKRTPRTVELAVLDQGIGIFRKIQQECGLATEHQAILELTKGKLTTDPERHTGEGVFFTSRMFDSFMIMSGRVSLHCNTSEGDWSLEAKKPRRGTKVFMQLSPKTKRTTQRVFNKYASPDSDYNFDTTHLVLRLMQPAGGMLVSRSQAKRLLARLERFREVVLDFGGIRSLGPAFADEVFRVFVRSNPEVHLTPINASGDVMKMIRRAIQAREGSPGANPKHR